MGMCQGLVDSTGHTDASTSDDETGQQDATQQHARQVGIDVGLAHVHLLLPEINADRLPG